jgi:hypothetical protein
VVVDEKTMKDAKDMKSLYNVKFEYHMEEVAKVVGMKYGEHANMEVRNLDNFAKSLEWNTDSANMKKACFVFYYSWKNCYSDIFGHSLAEHFEKEVMDGMNVTYEMEEQETGKVGCVAAYGLSCTNDFQCRLKQKLKKIVIFNRRIPKVMKAIGRKWKKSDYVFWIQRLENVDEAQWEKVSLGETVLYVRT